MEEFALLGLVLGSTGLTVIAGLIGYKTVWQPRRRRKLERDHFRRKLS